jgi:hypothetical protein
MTFLQRRLAFLPTRWVDKLTDLLPAFVVGLQAMRHRQHFIPIVAWSLVLWTALALVNFLILSSFHLSLPFYAPFLLLIVQAFGVTIPSGPGFVGTYHAAVVAGVSMFSVSQETALSVAIIMHAAFFFPFILTGLLFLWTENFSWRALSIVKARET